MKRETNDKMRRIPPANTWMDSTPVERLPESDQALLVDVRSLDSLHQAPRSIIGVKAAWSDRREMREQRRR